MKKLTAILFLTLCLFAQDDKMQIFKPITSSCPQSWLDDVKKEVNSSVEEVTLVDVKGLKNDIGIPQNIRSCNTSIYKDYVFEGNVPSLAINDFFKNPPKNAIGLALPAYENDKKIKTVFIMFENKSYKEFGKYK